MGGWFFLEGVGILRERERICTVLSYSRARRFAALRFVRHSPPAGRPTNRDSCLAAVHTGLAASIVLGPRVGFGTKHMRPYNIIYAMIGGALLWVGWCRTRAHSGTRAHTRAQADTGARTRALTHMRARATHAHAGMRAHACSYATQIDFIHIKHSRASNMGIKRVLINAD